MAVQQCSNRSCRSLLLLLSTAWIAEAEKVVILVPFCSSFSRSLRLRVGFKKVKGTSSSRPRGTSGGAAAGGGAEAAPTESESWEEFRHPQFRRGRRDLLVGIKRQKDGGRLKRKRGKLGVTSEETYHVM